MWEYTSNYFPPCKYVNLNEHFPFFFLFYVIHLKISFIRILCDIIYRQYIYTIQYNITFFNQYRHPTFKAYKQGLYGPKIVWILNDWIGNNWFKTGEGSDCTPEQIALAADGHIRTGKFNSDTGNIPQCLMKHILVIITLWER